MNAPFPSDKLQRFDRLTREYFRRINKDQQSQRGWYDEDGVRQGGLIAFVRYFWHVLEPETPFVDGWLLWAMVEHLEAVTFGEITRLLINVCPGGMKSLLTEVFFPAWEWGPMKRAHYRYVSFSYSASLTERDNDRFRTLLTSDAYQQLYGPLRVKIEHGDQVKRAEQGEHYAGGVELRNKTTIKVMNTHTGWKLASSVGGIGTGERGDRIIIDDPHNVIEAESERVRDETVRWFRESISSRFNDLSKGALIMIMQRVHEGDCAGVALGPEFDYCHLMIPWNYDPDRQTDEDGKPIPTMIGWTDPRDEDGEAAWPERFPDEAMARTKLELGEYAWASQYQQSPMPRGGGLFKRAWWQPWAPASGKFPEFDLVVASLDCAVTEKEENNPSGFTVWGVFPLPDNPEMTGIMLIHAFRKRLTMHGQPTGKRLEHEIPQIGDTLQNRINRETMWARRVGDQWGLVEWVAHYCRIRMVNVLLIEAEKGGIVAAQEMSRLYGDEPWAVHLRTVTGDKYARALAVQPMFSQNRVFAPTFDWSEMVIDEMEVFPRGKFDDLTDSTTQALKYIREVGLAQTQTEVMVEERERVTHRPRRKALYPV